MLFILLLNIMIIPIDSMYKSNIKFTSTGLEYQPSNNVQLLSIQTVQSKLRCSAACNKILSCRIFDYDTASKRCRLFEGDSTTGSIISSSISTSVVGIVSISSTLYSSTHNQSCQSCQYNRYESCSTNTSTCQCPVHTYWNGVICALQLFENETCNQPSACRSDFNLTCLSDCYGKYPKCISLATYNTTFSLSMRFGITVAGGCNGNTTGNQTSINSPADIMIDYNNSLYVADNPNRFTVFESNSYTGRVLKTYPNWPAFIFFDNRTSSMYISVLLSNLIYIWPSNTTIPSSGIAYGNCSMFCLRTPTGIAVDSVGNVYISSLNCNWITKWTSNTSNGTLIAGSPTGTAGTDSLSLYAPYGLALDEPNSFIYVADRFAFRIQRFDVGGSGVGVTVAGGNGDGSAPNQLSRPTDVYLSKLDGSLYICDCYNNRIQKWAKNATFGTTVAGSSAAVSGISPYLLNRPYALALDDQEKYVYVSDSVNNRVQRFSLY